MKLLNYPGYLLVLSILISLCGCEKFVAIDPPVTQAESNTIFEDDQAAVSAVTGLYSRMTQTNLIISSGAATLYPGLSADEIYNTTANADMDVFFNNSLPVNNGTGIYIRLWKPAYQHIYQANAVLEGLNRSTKITDSVKVQLTGEMFVTRALHYFYLVNYFGAVPYIEQTDFRVNQTLPRTPVDDIYAHLVTDLKQAKMLLKETYPSAGRNRPNKWTAAALLARVYLYQKDWVNAEAEATAVIQSTRYSLVTVLNNVFLSGSSETIWQLSRDNNNTGEGFTFVPASTTVRPAFGITPYLLNAFETNDKRKTSWLNKNTVAGIEYYYPYKYKVIAATPITESYVVLRLAEQYLIRAEAMAMRNNLTGTKADIDVTRVRAGLTGTTATTQTALMAAIEKERQVELFTEWGHRWLDIIRRGKADAVFGPIKSPNWQSTDVLYPIPLREIQYNSSLTQNPGY